MMCGHGSYSDGLAFEVLDEHGEGEGQHQVQQGAHDPDFKGLQGRSNHLAGGFGQFTDGDDARVAMSL